MTRLDEDGAECPACAAVVVGSARFCRLCGTAIDTSSPSSAGIDGSARRRAKHRWLPLGLAAVSAVAIGIGGAAGYQALSGDGSEVAAGDRRQAVAEAPASGSPGPPSAADHRRRDRAKGAVAGGGSADKPDVQREDSTDPPASVRNRSNSAPQVAAPLPPAGDPETWPAATGAWTVILASKATRQEAAAVAEQANHAGLPDVGLLNSSNHSSLRPGFWVAYSGVVDRPEAESLTDDATSAGFGDAYPRFVTATKEQR